MGLGISYYLWRAESSRIEAMKYIELKILRLGHIILSTLSKGHSTSVITIYKELRKTDVE